jgi:O-antigen ligase
VDVLLGYLALTTAATIRSPDPLHSVIGEPLQYQGQLASLCYGVALLAAGRAVVTEQRIRWLAGGIAAAATLVVAYGFVQQADLDPIWDTLNRGRMFSTLGQANNLAAYLVLALPLVLGLTLATQSLLHRLALFILAAAVIGALGLTFSRGGYLGGAAAVVAFAVLMGRRSVVTPRRLALAGASSLAIVALVAVMPPVADSAGRVVDRARQITEVEAGSGAFHVDLWAVGVQMAVENPLFGVGPEIYPALFPRYRDEILPPDRAALLSRFRPESPHNVPIAIAVGTGVPALAAYVALIVVALAAGLRRWRRARPTERALVAGVIAAVVGHVVTDVFVTAEVSTSWTFWVLLGVLATIPPRASAAEPR